MQTEDDEFPYTSDDPSLAPVEGSQPSVPAAPPPASDLKAALRLLIGSALNGSDVALARMRRMQAVQEASKPERVVIGENETAQDQLRYLLLGLLFETPEYLERRFSSAGQSSEKLYQTISRIFSPITDSVLFSPLRDQYDQAAARGEKVLDRLMMRGRIEEQNSRRMLQEKAIDDLLNEVVEYLVVKIKVQEIIEQEGATMAGDVLDEFRDESANVDTLVESKLRSIFRGGKSQEPPSEPPGPTERG